MSDKRILGIRSVPLRRAALVACLPLAALWVAPVSCLLLPFRIIANMASAAFSAAGDEWSETWATYDMRLLRTGFWWAWDADYHADPDAALKRANKKVSDQ